MEKFLAALAALAAAFIVLLFYFGEPEEKSPFPRDGLQPPKSQSTALPLQLNTEPTSTKPEEVSNDEKQFIEQAEQEARYHRDCLFNQNCNFANNDSREYSFRVVQSLDEEMTMVYHSLLDKPIKSNRLKQLAYELLEIEGVQKVAIRILSTQKPSAKDIDVFNQWVMTSYDTDVVGLVMSRYRIYRDAGLANKMHESFRIAILDGGVYVSRFVIHQLPNFLTASQLPKYREILPKMGARKLARDNLEQILATYENSLDLKREK